MHLFADKLHVVLCLIAGIVRIEMRARMLASVGEHDVCHKRNWRNGPLNVQYHTLGQLQQERGTCKHVGPQFVECQGVGRRICCKQSLRQ